MSLNHKEYNLETFKLAIENASDHIIITDNNGVILYANKAVEKITGYGNEEILGNKPSLWGGLMEKSFYKRLWRTIKVKKKPFIGEITNKRKNGEIYEAEIRISPVLDKERKIIYFVGIERDITKHKEIDRAKTEFVSLASHELRNPLTTINGYVEMLLKKGSRISDVKRDDYLTEVKAATKKMIETVDLLLNVSKIELGVFSVKLGKVNIKASIKNTIADNKYQINRKKISIKEKYKRGNLIIKSDQELLGIVLQNLISNAIKYTPSNGVITIECSRQQEGVLVLVSDTGIGIPQDQQKKIFSRLFRARNVKSTEGVGLGLYTVKMIVSKVKGKIWFTSSPKGTTFYLQLPV